MAYTNGDKITSSAENEALKEILSKIRGINSLKDVSEFLDLVFTYEEKRLIFRRILIFELLRQHRSYRNIIKSLKVSPATISNVKDIIEKRGYSKNPNRKRVYGSSYSALKEKKKEKKLFRKYKGSESII